jgi:hypothetical protein
LAQFDDGASSVHAQTDARAGRNVLLGKKALTIRDGALVRIEPFGNILLSAGSRAQEQDMYLGLALSPAAGGQEKSAPALPGTPVFTVRPTLSPATISVGDTVTLSLGTAAGTPDPMLSYLLVLDGADVTAEVSGGVFVPDRPGSLLLVVTATNAVATRSTVAGAQVAAIAASGWSVSSADGQISILSAPAAPAMPPVSASGLVITIGAAT